MVFDGSGHCISGDHRLSCPSFQTIETRGIVFAAPKPDRETVGLESEDLKIIYGFVDYVATNAFNVIDNLFDVAHLEFVHSGSFSGDSSCRNVTFEEHDRGFQLSYELPVHPTKSFEILAGSASCANVSATFIPPLGQIFRVRYDTGLEYGSIQWLCPLDDRHARLVQVGFAELEGVVDRGEELGRADWDIWVEDKAVLETIQNTFVQDLILAAASLAGIEPHTQHIVRASRRRLAG